MWEQLKPKQPGIIFYMQYEDFATIEVEKRLNKTSNIAHYVVEIDIPDVTQQCVDVYHLEDCQKVMESIKKEIEELYDNIPLYNDMEVNEWIDNFIDLLNDF